MLGSQPFKKTSLEIGGKFFDDPDHSSSTKTYHLAVNNRTRSKNSNSISNSHHHNKSNMSINLLVMMTSFSYILGTAPYSIYYIMSQFIQLDPMFSNISYLTLSAMHGVNIFIFYFFNKLFRQVFNMYLKTILFCFKLKNYWLSFDFNWWIKI